MQKSVKQTNLNHMKKIFLRGFKRRTDFTVNKLQLIKPYGIQSKKKDIETSFKYNKA